MASLLALTQSLPAFPVSLPPGFVTTVARKKKKKKPKTHQGFSLAYDIGLQPLALTPRQPRRIPKKLLRET